MRRTVVTILLSLLIVLLQASLVKYLAIGTIVPDIVLLWIVYVAIREGQLAATAAGFFMGLVIDLMSGQDGMLGLSALAKTSGGFIAGYFFNENKTLQTLGSYQFILILVIVSLVHNLIYFLIFLQGTDIGWWYAILLYGIPATLYTSVVGLLPMFAFAREYLT